MIWKKTKQTGASFIELIIYIALVSLVMVGFIIFTWDLIYGREKAIQHQVVAQGARLTMARIAYEIRQATDIQSVSTNQLVLSTSSGSTTIDLNSNRVRLTTGGVGPLPISSNQVNITSLSFTDVSSSDSNSKNILVSLAAEQSAAILSGQGLANTSLDQTVELNSQFNQARSLLMDTSAAALANSNQNLTATTLENTGVLDIVLDKITVSWTGGGGGTLDEILIGGSSVWSGTANTGDELDITNTTLTSGAGLVIIDYFAFSTSMADSEIIITNTMADGSSVTSAMTFPPAVTPGPSPTAGPSPTPTAGPTPTTGPGPTATPVPTTAPTPTTGAVNCSQHCQQTYGIAGSCIKSKDCSGYNEGRIYECSAPNICCCQ